MTQHIEPVAWIREGFIEDLYKDGTHSGIQTVMWLDESNPGKRHSKRIPLYDAAALAAAEERGRREERERIVERLWAEHANEHTKLGAMLAEKREDEIGTNWQGGKVNGLATAIQITKEPTP